MDLPTPFPTLWPFMSRRGYSLRLLLFRRLLLKFLFGEWLCLVFEGWFCNRFLYIALAWWQFLLADKTGRKGWYVFSKWIWLSFAFSRFRFMVILYFDDILCIGLILQGIIYRLRLISCIDIVFCLVFEKLLDSRFIDCKFILVCLFMGLCNDLIFLLLLLAQLIPFNWGQLNQLGPTILLIEST